MLCSQTHVVFITTHNHTRASHIFSFWHLSFGFDKSCDVRKIKKKHIAQLLPLRKTKWKEQIPPSRLTKQVINNTNFISVCLARIKWCACVCACVVATASTTFVKLIYFSVSDKSRREKFSRKCDVETVNFLLANRNRNRNRWLE